MAYKCVVLLAVIFLSGIGRVSATWGEVLARNMRRSALRNATTKMYLSEGAEAEIGSLSTPRPD